MQTSLDEKIVFSKHQNQKRDLPHINTVLGRTPCESCEASLHDYKCDVEGCPKLTAWLMNGEPYNGTY